MKFRKKPVVIEAVQFTDQWVEDHLFDGRPLPDGVDLTRASYHGTDRKLHSYRAVIATLEGEMEVADGDWVITGIQGEHYPCKPDIFAATYESADDASAPDRVEELALSD